MREPQHAKNLTIKLSRLSELNDVRPRARSARGSPLLRPSQSTLSISPRLFTCVRPSPVPVKLHERLRSGRGGKEMLGDFLCRNLRLICNSLIHIQLLIEG